MYSISPAYNYSPFSQCIRNCDKLSVGENFPNGVALTCSFRKFISRCSHSSDPTKSLRSD